MLPDVKYSDCRTNINSLVRKSIESHLEIIDQRKAKILKQSLKNSFYLVFYTIHHIQLN